MPKPIVILRAFVILAFGLLGILCPSAQTGYVAAANSGMAAMAAPKASASTKVPHPTLLCPPAGLLSASAPSSDSGHHRVTLSWNASTASAQQTGNVVGYCLYRSKKQHVAKKNPTCTSCERINTVPVTSLSCIDDLVENNATYFYVVTAISPANRISSPSNEIAASIPSGRQASSAPSTSAPFCRVPASGK